jgi:phenylalanyl-tRNA synthetase alpha chain
MTTLENLKQIRQDAIAELSTITKLPELDALSLKYLGRKNGILNNILKELKNLGPKDKKTIGSEANVIKLEIWKLIDVKREQIKNVGKKEFIDLTASRYQPELGHLHPVTQIRREIENIFKRLGFAVMSGPEVESDYYNFESLNMPQEHPARDMWDTFYLKDQPKNSSEKLLLRTHISPMQVRVMEKHKPPFAVVSSGRVFRHEATDARHEHTYDYTEGFLVGENVSLAQLKNVLVDLFKALFGPDVEIKLRSSYFPFTEPSIELLMGCIFCNKKGCPVCHTGWLEMLGAGMIHPKVFEFAGYPKNKWTGFAFGIGISRVAMLKYNIPDIRLLYQNDQRFLNQF